MATGLALGRQPLPELAAKAVQQAMERAGLKRASSVLLFLSQDFARNPQPALRAAAVMASTTQVSGCAAPGVFTEDEWVMDASAAAAMVFGEDGGLEVASGKASLMITLTAPNALNAAWLQLPGVRLGGVAGDATGRGGFSVWAHGKRVLRGHCELALHGVQSMLLTSHSLKLLSAPQRIVATDAMELRQLEGQSALASLKNALGAGNVEASSDLPYHQLMALVAKDKATLLGGGGVPVAMIAVDEEVQSVTMARAVDAGDWLAWGVLDAQAAQETLVRQLAAADINQSLQPDFCLMFSCLARGPHLYGGIDRDIELLKQRYPGMPLIGFYGNGEIAPINGCNELLQHSAVLGLFSARDEHDDKYTINH